MKIDNQDVRGVVLQGLRQVMGDVPQVPVLLNDNVMIVINNVRYSKQDATDDDIVKACTAAAVHEKILSFTVGYETMVGENGVKLSDGEIQRISIARAILKDPTIILLSEATSTVHSEIECLRFAS